VGDFYSKWFKSEEKALTELAVIRNIRLVPKGTVKVER
jgi:hypothetical protein